MAKLDIECCPICCAPIKAIQTCNSVRFEYDGPRWISVEERLPEPKEDVALYIRCGDVSFIRTGWRMGNGQFICPNDSLSCYEVTHWMPLPEMPKEE